MVNTQIQLPQYPAQGSIISGDRAAGVGGLGSQGRDLLANLKATNPLINFNCNSSQCNRNCKICSYYNPGNVFYSAYSKYKFILGISNEARRSDKPVLFNCLSKNIIYMITCNRCNMKYIGETERDLASRFGEHLRSIEKHSDRSKTLVDHFNNGTCKLQNCYIQIIEKINDSGDKIKDRAYRQNRESYWIRKLRTKLPYGLNEKLPDFLDINSVFFNLTTFNKNSKKRGKRKRNTFTNFVSEQFVHEISNLRHLQTLRHFA